MIAGHTVWNHLEKIQDPFTFASRKKLVVDDELMHALTSIDFEKQLFARQQIRVIGDCLDEDSVSDIEKMTFKLHYFNARSLKAIAELTAKTSGAIRTIKSRAVAKVKKCLQLILENNAPKKKM